MQLKNFPLALTVFMALDVAAQTSYADSIDHYHLNYVAEHEVVKGDDRDKLKFFTPDEQFRVLARFERKEQSAWLQMKTSAASTKIYRIYGVITFTIHDTVLRLNLYQSQALMESEKYRNLLFLPFTDRTTGKESYDGGRYIDLDLNSIQNNKVLIDFNKAYNPYCAYVSGRYSCPIPPAENNLAVAVRAGEMRYGDH
jgi:uncharacterized protein